MKELEDQVSQSKDSLQRLEEERTALFAKVGSDTNNGAVKVSAVQRFTLKLKLK